MMKTAIPEALMTLLSGENLKDKQREAFLLQTVNEDGWPHSAMISVGEVLAADPYTFHLMLWPNTMTTINLMRSKKAQLVIIYEGLVYYIKLQIKHHSAVLSDIHTGERFSAHIHALKIDKAKYAKIETGIQVKLHNPDSVIDRWQAQVEILKHNPY
ncbi:pyridoxamine 5'-phosphate oxidase family protein [Paenibacillus polygoni]|uniref:Pyridoxamine 5'-phosphate oxidase family protein n=1 Tax=Paenibacillus polygoni TaxID=3050112 RepID=A0ABY8XBV1_9BACL|nr:pyridoxamine 5'-phosphate oxidase family protein [Paenibacillus polygoni]WIV20695.1 pyridoxamine 5'-phosphate oxidase family protein [Paenibacillus polygoni]